MDDVSKEDLLVLLACLQGELEARETVIEALKCEKAGCSSVLKDHSSLGVCEPRPCNSGNPYHALYRDSLITPTSSDGDAALKPLYDSQLIQLENLITSQRRAQEKMRERIILVEEKYLKACETLEEQRKKHERDTAEGDDVLVLLGKEREKLKSEVEHEKLQNQRLEKELKTLQTSWCEQRLMLQKQRQAGVFLWKARRSLLNRLTRAQDRITELEKELESRDSGLSHRLPTLSPVGSSASGPHSGDCVAREKTLDCPVTSEPCRCEDLRNRLNEETASRLLVEEKHERLQRKYEALLAATSRRTHVEPDTSFSLEGDTCVNAIPGVAKPRGDSPPRFQRFKPDPPARRSSEITSSVSGYTGCSSIDGSCNDMHSELTQPISEPTIMHKHESGVIKGSGFACDVTSSLSAKLASLSTESSFSSGLSESRSSTPSPPPPPPPIHLHYPYPGMQSQSHHSSLRGPSDATQYLCSVPCDRPLSGPPMHSNPGSKVRGLLNPHLPRQPLTPYQPSYPNSSVLLGARMQKLRVGTGRRSIPRKPVTVAIPESASLPVAYHNQYPSFSSTQANQQPSHFPPSHFIHSSGGLNPSNHHLHAYSPTLPHPPVPTINPVQHGTARSSRPVPPSAAGLASGTIPINTGHVCVNGK
ncbi:unnamed protein product [Dicrocoelium dendriticum]|nr:unnamed protein product [Dicrocoelium dendriticum]